MDVEAEDGSSQAGVVPVVIGWRDPAFYVTGRARLAYTHLMSDTQHNDRLYFAKNAYGEDSLWFGDPILSRYPEEIDLRLNTPAAVKALWEALTRGVEDQTDYDQQEGQ